MLAEALLLHEVDVEVAVLRVLVLLVEVSAGAVYVGELLVPNQEEDGVPFVEHILLHDVVLDACKQLRAAHVSRDNLPRGRGRWGSQIGVREERSRLLTD